MNKKGAETTIGTIVVVILAVLVLVVVIYGFTQGWTKLWERINIFTPAAQSIDAVSGKCSTMCLADQKYSYCCDKQKVKINNDIVEKDCNKLKTENKLPITCETIDCTAVLTCTQ
jgi:hypothetical protein